MDENGSFYKRLRYGVAWPASKTWFTRYVGFRAEKRSAQASAHPLSQAQGGLFCVLTLVCLFVTERVLTKTE